MVDVKGNLARVRERIAAAAKRAGVDAGGITLVAISKTKPASMVREAIGAGASVFGENYVQEGVVKAEEFQDLAEWHFIGHLQRNKVRLVAERFDMVESVDSLALASRLDAACGAIGRRLDVLMQIHYGLEESKHGFYPEEAGEAEEPAPCCCCAQPVRHANRNASVRVKTATPQRRVVALSIIRGRSFHRARSAQPRLSPSRFIL